MCLVDGTSPSNRTLLQLNGHLHVNPTTPTFLSDVDAAPETNPVVYSPVPTISTAGGAMADNFDDGRGRINPDWG
jgi:hypothetical protein